MRSSSAQAGLSRNGSTRSLDDPLPACREIASGEQFASPGEIDFDYVRERAGEAMDELGALVRSSR